MKISPAELIGPLEIRRFHLARICDAHEGHEHNYDHDTIVISGRVRVFYAKGTDGQSAPSESQDFGPGDVVFIAARVAHTVKALENDTRYLCVFSHRDFDGRVSQEYVGNAEACGHDRLREPTPSVHVPLTGTRFA
jgi:quercetin dioxygenase-like cupin family protein